MAQQQADPTRQAPRVLVVDDRLEMAEMVADALRDQGYQTVCLDSGRQAVDLLRTQHFDAVVTDLRMPEVDGLAVLSASRALDRRRPVLVMTALDAMDSAQESLRRGAYQTLTKPFKTEELAVLLSRALEEAREGPPAATAVTFSGEVLSLGELQRRYARWAFERLGGQLGETAVALGVDVQTLARWLELAPPAAARSPHVP